MQQSEPVASPVGHRLPGFADYQGIGLRQQLPVERKWALGLQVKFLQCCYQLALGSHVAVL